METDEKTKGRRRFQVFLNVVALKEWLSSSLVLEKSSIGKKNEDLSPSFTTQQKDTFFLVR